MSEAWPELLKPVSFGFWPENASRSGGPALNGAEQTVASGAGRWRAAGTFRVRNDAQVRAARAFFAKVQGRAVEIRLPAFDGRRANWPIDAQGRVLHPGATRRKALDGTVYEDPEIPPQSEIIATLNVGAAIGVSQTQINMTQGSPLRIGQYFGLGPDRLYIINEIVNVAGSVTTVRFWPPIREAGTLGQEVRLTRPQCLVKLLSDENVLRELELLRFADLTLEFRESF